MQTNLSWWVLGTSLVGLFLVANTTGGCGDDDAGTQPATSTSVGAAPQGGAGPGTGGSGTGGTSTSTGSGVPPPPTEEAPCQGHVYECGDLEDNDGDGLIDYQDPDCLGPCDDTEDSYFGGISGSWGGNCNLDCYFDQDGGSGNDDCFWNHQCDEHEMAPNYYPEACMGEACAYDPSVNLSGTDQTCDQLYAAQSQTCLDFCGPLTPNGCDCFGCCELPAGSGQYVWLGSDEDCNGSNGGSCNEASINDPDKCQPCKPVTACLNECETCELCIGKTVLPPECDDPEGQQCPEGVQQCGLAGQDPCPSGYYCISGCCIDIVQ